MSSSSTVGNMGNGAILLHMYVEPVLIEVLSDHLARPDDTVLLGEFSLRKELAVTLKLVASYQVLNIIPTHSLVGFLAVMQLLPRQLVQPLLSLVARLRGHARNNERHCEW